jgi:hypothetical protein
MVKTKFLSTRSEYYLLKVNRLVTTVLNLEKSVLLITQTTCPGTGEPDQSAAEAFDKT